MNNKVWLSIKKNRWWILIFTFAAAYYGHMAFMALARQHFKAHCENDAGEFIYKTVENVEGIYQMRPREPLYYFDTLRHYRHGRRELMEDPYGHTDVEGQRPWVLFVREPENGSPSYLFLETTRAPNLTDNRYPKINVEDAKRIIDLGKKYWLYRSLGIVSQNNLSSIYSVKNVDKLQSRYGYTWREVRSWWDKLFGIWGGETIVKDLETDETLAVKRGYFSFDFGICPKGDDSFFIHKFLIKVLKPVKQEFKYIPK